MPRLLILCEYSTVLGGERSMLATLPAIAAAGFEICIAAPSTGGLPVVIHDRGIAHIVWHTHDESGHRRPLAELRADLATAIRHIAPDLIHANSLSTARIAGPVASQLSMRSIGHLRDIIKLSASTVADLNQHLALIAVSNATRDFHLQQGLQPQKCRFLYNGVDLSEFQPRPSTGYLHRELAIPNDSRLIAVIGQLGLRKGTDVALASARNTIEQFPETHWLIVGERTSAKAESREFEMRLRQMAAETSLRSHIHFLGNRTDIASLLAECTLLVHAAHQEPLGRVLLEAAAAGTAIVATNVGGTPEIFPSEFESAILVPPNDPDAITSAVSSLLANEPRRLSYAYAAHRRAESAFDIRDAARRLVRQYQLTLG
jgi:glycosyltransferase involved in cell wall biosynthesis